MKIKKLLSNWFQSGYSGGDFGEDYDSYIVGERGVLEIVEHKAQGAGDKWYYDVICETGETIRLFNPNTIIFEKDKP